MPSAHTFFFAAYLTYGFVCILVALVLWGFYRRHRRDYLRMWALSWAALVVDLCAMALGTHLAGLEEGGELVYAATHPLRRIVSSVSILGGTWQTVFVLFGTWELLAARRAPLKALAWTLAACALASVAPVELTQRWPRDASGLARESIHSFASGLGFVAAGWCILRMGWREHSYGRLMLALSLPLYGAQQVNYFANHLGRYTGAFDQSLYQSFASFVDIALSAVIGLGMVVWHKDEESARAEEAAAALQRSREQLARVQKMEVVSRVAGAIAHDFNNLLTSVLGYASLLEASVPPGGRPAAGVRKIQEAAGRAKELTRELLTFSRRKPARIESLDLSREIARLEDVLRRIAGRDTEIVMALEPVPGPVRVDPADFEQVVFNLVMNARDALPRGGRIQLSTTRQDVGAAEAESLHLRPGPYVRFDCADDGVGMDDETRDHVFEPFFTTKPPGQGTGLGLASVYGIVTQAGGAVRVDSAVNQGTRMSVLLPCAAGEPAS